MTDFIFGPSGYTPSTNFVFAEIIHDATGVGAILLAQTSEAGANQSTGIGAATLSGLSPTQYIPNRIGVGAVTLGQASAVEFIVNHVGVGAIKLRWMSWVDHPIQKVGVGAIPATTTSAVEYIPYLFNPGVDPQFNLVEIYTGCGYYEGDTDCRDRSRNHHTLTAMNGAQVVQVEPTYNGGVLAFDGIDDCVSSGSGISVSPSSSDFTFEARIYPDGLTADGGVGYIGTYGSSAGEVLLVMTANYGLIGYVNDGLGTTFTIATADAVIDDQVWTHVAFTRGASELSLYVNGVKLTSTAIGSESFLPNDQIFIGYAFYGSNCFFKGKIEEFIYARAEKYATEFTPRERSYRYELPIGTREFEERKQKRPAKPRALNQNYFVQRTGI